jgi:hypothetical protein
LNRLFQPFEFAFCHMYHYNDTCERVNSKGGVNAHLDGVVVLGAAVAGIVFEVAELSLAPGGARGHFHPE